MTLKDVKMNKFATIIETTVAKFEAELAKTNNLAQVIIDSDFDADIVYNLFSQDASIWSAVKDKRLIDLKNIFKGRILERFWREFFQAIELHKHLGDQKADRIVEKYQPRYGRYFNMEEVELNVDTLTTFVNEYMVEDTSYDEKIAREFLRCNIGDYNKPKTEYKTRNTIRNLVNGSRISDYAEHALSQLVSMVARNFLNQNVSVVDVKSIINHQYGDKDFERTLVEGIEIKCKPNGNADLKLSKDIVEFLNNRL